MKKLLALVMAILMMLCTFASCGGGGASGNTELPDDEKHQTEDNGQSGNIENDKPENGGQTNQGNNGQNTGNGNGSNGGGNEGNAEGDKPTGEGSTEGEKNEDVKIEFNTLSLDGNIASGVVSNASSSFNFEVEISISDGLEFVISR